MPRSDSVHPPVVTQSEQLRDTVRRARGSGKTIGLVPTMGALHEGHLSLVRRSVSECDLTVVTIFVNPTQFGPHEDFSRYPRTLDSDLETLADARADLVFVPFADQMYPEGFSTYVEPPEVARPLEGICRPGHFRGVATVVLKLFNLVAADIAFFGQKDYQQARVIQDMTRDLDLPLRIEVCPIIREKDGLAMSSRNRFLTADERRRSLGLFRALERATALASQGQRATPVLCEAMRGTLLESGIEKIDYAVIVDPQTLQEAPEASDDSIALIAAHVGKTRLIDNRRMG